MSADVDRRPQYEQAQITLLLAGVRNAWDMMLWIVIRAPTPNVGDRGDAASN